MMILVTVLLPIPGVEVVVHLKNTLSINSSKNSTFNGSVTSNTGFVTNEGNLKRLSSLR